MSLSHRHTHDRKPGVHYISPVFHPVEAELARLALPGKADLPKAGKKVERKPGEPRTGRGVSVFRSLSAEDQRLIPLYGIPPAHARALGILIRHAGQLVRVNAFMTTEKSARAAISMLRARVNFPIPALKGAGGKLLGWMISREAAAAIIARRDEGVQP